MTRPGWRMRVARICSGCPFSRTRIPCLRNSRDASSNEYGPKTRSRRLGLGWPLIKTRSDSRAPDMRCSHNLRRFSEFRRKMNRSSFEAAGIACVELSALLFSSCGPNTDGHRTEKELQNEILYADF